MAHVLSLVYGSTTIALASGDYRIVGYVPASPDIGDVDVTETAVIRVSGATIATLQTNIQAIEKAFDRARLRREGKTLTRVFVQFQPDSYTAAHQAEILSGRVLLPESTLKADWANKELEITIIWTRSPVWEAVDWTAMPISNSNGTDVTTGLRLFNCGDGVGAAPNKREFHANIAAASVAGDLPAPVKLRITPEQDNIRNSLFIGTYADLDGLGYPAMFAEMEDWAGAGGSTAADATCSGGNYRAVPVTTSWTPVINKSGFSLANYRGSYLRFFLRLQDSSSLGAWLKLRLSYGNILAETTPVQAGSFLIDLGLIKLPAGFQYLANHVAPNFTLYAKDSASGTINADVLMWMGVDSYVSLRDEANFALVTPYRMIEQWGLDRQSYVEKTDGTAQFQLYNRTAGDGIYLTPGVNNRLFLLTKKAAVPAADITNSCLVECWYKPRRLTL